MAESAPSQRSRIVEACRRFSEVRASDPVRAALNAGLSWVLAAFAVLALAMGVVVQAIGRPMLTVAVTLAVTPLCGVCWWLNRVGTTAGAWGLVLLLIAASTLAIDPQLYAGPVPTVDVAFMYAILVAALFVRPGAAGIAWALQLVSLAAAALVARLPAHQVIDFLVEAAIELGALGAMAAIGARIFRKAQKEALDRSEALASSQARVRQLIEASVVGVVIAEIDGDILQVNDAFLAMLGGTRADFEAGRFQRGSYLTPQAREISRLAMQKLKQDGAATYEIEVRHRNGSLLPVLVSASRFEGSNEGVAFVIDMTEARRLEQERQGRLQAEAASQAKTAFLASMSHELRTPLNAVLGFTQLMLAQDGLAAEHRRWLRLVEDSGTHLLRLVEEVLDLARVESGRMELRPEGFEVAPWLENLQATGELRAAAQALRFQLQAAGLPARVVGDEVRLRQVLLNLLENAVKFTASGHVTLRVQALEPVREGLCRLRFEVEDSGVGISESDRHRIFEAFEQAGEGASQRQGAGLGLAISRQLVRMMGGELQVRSVPGAGATFHFEIDLPLLAVA